MIKIGIIGGSGLEDPQILTKVREEEVDTPYGKPTSPLKHGMIHEKEVVLISRHGRNHQFSPTEVNYRANLFALKEAGVTHILATTACGSLKEEIGRGHFVVLDQFIDFTKHRINTYADKFESGIVHAPMATPFDERLRVLLYTAATELNFPVHPRGTVVTIEGPRFSTRAESRMFQLWGADVVNMSVATEATLANELNIPYAAIAMSTDYDCWKEDEAAVSWEEIVRIFNQNAENVKKVLTDVIERIS
ncbi:MAG: S-methyl-5'-thioadenosine phosphorylase [Flavisolibacter sp.]